MNSFSTFVRRQAGGEIESDDSDEYQTPSERGDIYKFGLSEIPLIDLKAALRYVREAAYSGTAPDVFDFKLKRPLSLSKGAPLARKTVARKTKRIGYCFGADGSRRLYQNDETIGNT